MLGVSKEDEPKGTTVCVVTYQSDVKTRGTNSLYDEPGGNLLTDQVASGVEVA